MVGERSDYSEAPMWVGVERSEVRMPVWVAFADENSACRIPKVSSSTFVEGGLVGSKEEAIFGYIPMYKPFKVRLQENVD